MAVAVAAMAVTVAVAEAQVGADSSYCCTLLIRQVLQFVLHSGADLNSTSRTRADRLLNFSLGNHFVWPTATCYASNCCTLLLATDEAFKRQKPQPRIRRWRRRRRSKDDGYR